MERKKAAVPVLLRKHAFERREYNAIGFLCQQIFFIFKPLQLSFF